MRSYASIDRIECGFAVCEVELIEEEISRWFEYGEKDTIMIDVPLSLIEESIGNVEEGDVLVVECENNVVDYIYCKDNDEKVRRLRELNGFFESTE